MESVGAAGKLPGLTGESVGAAGKLPGLTGESVGAAGNLPSLIRTCRLEGTEIDGFDENFQPNDMKSGFGWKPEFDWKFLRNEAARAAPLYEG
jgi:hypothetical protein